MSRAAAARLAALLCASLLIMGPKALAGDDDPVPSSSLHGYSGLWAMPDSRVLPDWQARTGISDDGPYRSYHGAVGLFDRVEAHGRITEIETVEPFPGEGFGDYKDRSAGLKIVLLPEGGIAPQVAAGATDVTGTAVFAARYLSASKRLGEFDLTLGLGQGALAGEDVSGIEAGGQSSLKAGHNFLTSSPWRETRLFGGAAWRIKPWISLVVEYSSMDYEALYGFEGRQDWPVNAGLKIEPLEHMRLSAALMRGRDPAFGLEVHFPLEPEALLTWRSEPEYAATEKERWQAYEAEDRTLAEMLAKAIEADGFKQVTVSAGGRAVRVEVVNDRYLSDARAFGRMGRVITSLAPDRITVLYFVLTGRSGPLKSLRCERALLEDYLNSRIDLETFNAFSDLDRFDTEHVEEFAAEAGKPETYRVSGPAMSYKVSPMLHTFMENRRGFFKHKAGMRQSVEYETSENVLAVFGLETSLYNEYGQASFRELESEPARTDIVRYESGRGSRLTTAVLQQTAFLPLDVVGRISFGALETAYSGFGGELFRFFGDGRYGAGVEGWMVMKRDPDSSFGPDPDSTRVFSTAYLNLYGLLIPEQGVAGGVKIGRFLAGDPGVRIELARTYKHFTLGAWYTVTDTSIFSSSRNVGNRDKGVYIRVPLAVFRSADEPGHFRYSLSSFTRDQGQTVNRPGALYPMDNGEIPAPADLEEMRR